MNKKIYISKLLIAALFLTAYCNILVTQLTCNLPHLLEATKQDGHHHDNDDAEHDHSDSHKHNDSKDDNCCNDKTAAFFASQINPVNPTFEFKNTFFAKIIFSPNCIINFPLPLNSEGYFSYRAPPPKMPDIRVFIQSFQI